MLSQRKKDDKPYNKAEYTGAHPAACDKDHIRDLCFSVVSAMASADVRDELLCSICLSTFTDPVILRCGHNFCRGCIDQFLNTQDEFGDYFCPQCRAQFPQRPSLIKNIALHNVAERLVEETPAVKCSTHKMTLEYYCTEDAAYICVYCLAEEHRQHQVEKLEEALEKKKEKLRNVLRQLNTMSKKTEERLQSVEERKKKALEKTSGETKRITDLFTEIRRRLTDLEKRTMSEISRQEKQVLRSLSDVTKKLEIRKDELSKKIRHIEDLCNMMDPFTVLQDPDTGDLSDPEGGEGDEDTRGHDTTHDVDMDMITGMLDTGFTDVVTYLQTNKTAKAMRPQPQARFPWRPVSDIITVTGLPLLRPVSATTSAKDTTFLRPVSSITTVTGNTLQRPVSSITTATGNTLQRPFSATTNATGFSLLRLVSANITGTSPSSLQPSPPLSQAPASNTQSLPSHTRASHYKGSVRFGTRWKGATAGKGPTDILLDVNTAGNFILISDDLKTATATQIWQKRPATAERLEGNFQVMSHNGFSSGRHEWDVEIRRSEDWSVGMCYPSVERTGGNAGIGDSTKSWGLQGRLLYKGQYTVRHDRTSIRLPHKISSDRVRICLDYEAGQLSFYELCDPIRHLHTFTATFSEPLHAVISVSRGSLQISGKEGEEL
ncbi:E3 ubiquitin-protein ligase TRIM7-like [Dendropsophus ebraccatus]|uniref:E3 ubiquitin-protein ligase TRIM7-like n=1 Tax=Dendropsophus ebraccatus TaxID=150705 RepID=UPI0038318F5A